MKQNSKTKNLTLSALFLALGMVLPFLTGQIPTIGSMLLPMHIPIFLCAFIVGAPHAFLIGVITPLLRSMLFGMPPMISAMIMAFELGAYGCIAGFLYQKTNKLYFSLIASMLLGRIVWGMVSAIVYGMQSSAFGMQAFIAGGFTNAFLGIILQLILIPVIVKLVQKNK